MSQTAKKHIFLLLLLIISTSCKERKNIKSPWSKLTKKEIKDDIDRYSYVIGRAFGERLKRQNFPTNEILLKAIEEALLGKSSLLDPREMQKATMDMQVFIKQREKQRALKVKQEGEKFLEEHKKDPEIKVTSSGLQYKIIKQGSGDPPKNGDTVKVHYRGTLIDGTEFDNSYKKGDPIELSISKVIPGWKEALKLMKPGAKLDLAIPPELAYGNNSRPAIPANSVLLFTLELVAIK